MQQGPFAPRALPRFLATTSLAAAVSSSADFPGDAGYTTDLLHRLLDGTRTVSPVARHVLVTVLPLTTPPEWQAVSVSPAACHTAFAPNERARPPDLILSRPPLGSLALRPGDSLTIPKMALSVSLIRFVSSTNPTQATGFRLLPRRDCLPLNMSAFAGRTSVQQLD